MRYNSKDNLYEMFLEVNSILTVDEISDKLFIHKGTIRRWSDKKQVPKNYYEDFNRLLGNKYNNDTSAKDKDQFYTSKKTAKYCYDKTKEILTSLDINVKDYVYIEPSVGAGSFYNILPSNRIGIDIDQVTKTNDIINCNFLDYTPPKNKKYIVIGNPPFGLRGNLALRFIEHSSNFADAVSFILPPLFDSTGKGVPCKRIKNYKLAYSERLPSNSFECPDGKKKNIPTIFQIYIKINTDKIKLSRTKTCKSIAKIYSLSDGGTPSTTRNKKMIDKCNVYLPSTCFKGMKAYKSFLELPNKRGYGVLFYKNKEELTDIFFNAIDWEEVSFLSTNSSMNLRTDLIENEITKRGFYDKYSR